MPFADSQGIRIYYNDTGEGEPALLCLPGWCNDHTIFAPLAERLGAGHRVLAMDWPGHGRLGPPVDVLHVYAQPRAPEFLSAAFYSATTRVREELRSWS